MSNKKTYWGLLACGITLTALNACDSSSGFDEEPKISQKPDPVVVDYPVAYIERPIPRDEDGNIVSADVLDPSAFNPGARILIKDRASVGADSVTITDIVFTDPDSGIVGLYDVKDLSVSYDGSKLLFAMRAPEIEDADEDEQPSWNIWEYDREADNLRRLISSDLVAELGDDIDPHYLADGRIVFSSTRQPRSKAVLLDEAKPQFFPGTEADRAEATFVLHVMDEDGDNIQQISYNQSHDLAPTVLSDGRLLFLRWDNYVGANLDHLSLYTARSDGSELSLHYGYHSQSTGTNDGEAAFIDPIEMPDGRVLVSLRARQSLVQGGDLALIDTQQFTEISEPVFGAGAGGSAQISLTEGRSHTDGSISPKGYFSSAYPLFDGTNRLLASWSACLVEGIKLGVYLNLDGELINGLGEYVDAEGNVLSAGASPRVAKASDVGSYPCSGASGILDQVSTPPPLYGIWSFNLDDDTQRPVVLADKDTMYTEAVVLTERPIPEFDTPPIIDDRRQALIDANLGEVHIRSVYDLDGEDQTLNGIDVMADPLATAVDQRPARFLRILKAVSLPDRDTYDFDTSAFGRAGRQMKDILGYVPIEPDGSVKFQVPADVAFTFSVLDANGRRLDNALGNRHSNWMSVRPGESFECRGCHSANDTSPHARPEAQATSAWPGAAGGASFPNTTLLDRLGVPHPAPDAGESMAEYYARVNDGARVPSVDIRFVDEWTDEAILAKTPSFNLSYTDLTSKAPPTSGACQTMWSGLCRIVINYVEHIQPLWDASRVTLDPNDASVVLADTTCTGCHSGSDAAGQAQVPAGQLELTGMQSVDNNNYITSYNELLFPDVPQEVVGGVLVNILEQDVDADGNPLFVVDADGNQVLDNAGNPIPVLVEVSPNPAYLSPAGARNNTRFFNLFAAGGSHAGYLNPAELKLLSEWLDIGGQYYNNPFAAPEN